MHHFALTIVRREPRQLFVDIQANNCSIRLQTASAWASGHAIWIEYLELTFDTIQ